MFHFEEGCVGKAKTSFVEEKKKKARFHCDADVNKKIRVCSHPAGVNGSDEPEEDAGKPRQ